MADHSRWKIDNRPSAAGSANASLQQSALSIVSAAGPRTPWLVRRPHIYCSASWQDWQGGCFHSINVPPQLCCSIVPLIIVRTSHSRLDSTRAVLAWPAGRPPPILHRVVRPAGAHHGCGGAAQLPRRSPGRVPLHQEPRGESILRFTVTCLLRWSMLLTTVS